MTRKQRTGSLIILHFRWDHNCKYKTTIKVPSFGHINTYKRIIKYKGFNTIDFSTF